MSPTPKSVKIAISGWTLTNRAAEKHKAALASINSIEELEKYDIGSGWPVNVLDK